MEKTDQERLELLKKIQAALVKHTDEMEGKQVIDITGIDACALDSGFIEKPLLTPDDINKMLHFSDFVKPTPPSSDMTGDMTPGMGGLGAGLGTNPFGEWGKIALPEGVDLNDIAQKIIDDDTVGPTKAIIEFAQDSVYNKDGVDYELYVNPGEQLTASTIIGRVKIDGETKPIRSIFATGNVEQNNDGSYMRLLSDSCNRHIIINNYTIGFEDEIVDTNKIEAIGNNFKKEAELHQLITDNLCESVMPYILQKRHLLPLFSALGIIQLRPNGRDIYQDFMKDVEKVRDKYQKDMKKLGTEENIKKTNGSTKKIKALGDKIINRRYKHYLNIKELYFEKKKSLPKCEYDASYEDCKYLAFDNGTKTTTYIANKDYNNYYMALLSKIDISSNDNTYNIEYYNILKKIIEVRMCFESYSLDSLIKEFNKQFKKRANSKMRNAYEKMTHDLGIVNSKDYTEINSWISKNYRYKNDEYMQYRIKQFTNMYLFIRTYNKYSWEVKEDGSTNKITSLLNLVKQENKILEEFWAKCIAEYEAFSLENCINEVQTLVDSQSKYATWPAPGTLTIEGTTYKHYLFANTRSDMQDPYPDNYDEDEGMDYSTEQPEIPTECEVMPAEQDFLLDNDDDAQPNEPGPHTFKYWQKYFSLATVISIPFLNCGIDIPPFVMMIPLPCIFICLGVCYIQILDITLVFGLSIRGMYIWPIILYVNLSNNYANIMTPLIAILKNILAKIQAKIETLSEAPITSIVNGLIGALENDNYNLRNSNKEIEVQIAALKSKHNKNKKLIEDRMKKLLNPDANLNMQVLDPIKSAKK